jgi:hypothetical protein
MRMSLYRWAIKWIVLSSSFFFSLSALAEPLDASGASWLFPLTGETVNNGFCNAPRLSSGLVLDSSQFSSIVSRMISDSPEQACTGLNNPVLGVLLEGDEGFMRSCNHLAQLNGIRDEPSRAASWHVVGFRFDPCVNAGPRNLSSTADLNGCSAEARLVAQPFILNADGRREVIDASLHLIYEVKGVSGISEIVRDLKSVQNVTKSVAGSAYPAASLFTVHPGLELERRRGECNGTSSRSISNFLAKHTNPSKLAQVAFMTSSGGLKQWSFGFLGPNSGFKFGTTPIGRFDNFSDALLSQGIFPVNQENRTANSMLNISQSFELVSIGQERALSESQKAEARTQLDVLNDLMNPKATLQIDQSCVGCHMAPQLFRSLARHAGVPQAVGTRPYSNSLSFPNFSNSNRSFVNLRNFGYGSGFAPGVSQRTLNEIDRTRSDLNRIFP